MRPADGSMPRPAVRQVRRPVLVATVVILVAFNLRPALTSVGPLLNRIVEATGIGASGASLLTTLPVLCLGLAGALGPFTIRTIGLDRGVLAGILAVAVGLALHGLGGVVSLFVGSAVAAAGIGVAGVLLPALVKRDFGGGAGMMMGVYTMALCLGAGASAGLTIPLQAYLGLSWAGALALWSVPALAGALVWAPFARRAPTVGPAAADSPRLWRNPLAWQVTGFMGLQSSLAYILFGWLPALLESRGLGALEAGLVASVMTLAQAPGGLAIPALASRARDQRGWIVGTLLVTMAAFLGMAFGPSAGLVPAGFVLGIGLGGCFGLGLTLIVLRAGDAAVAGSLSAMAQSIGYAVASLGPFGFGLAHTLSGGWTAPAALFCAFGLASLACGLGAGRALVIDGQAARGP